MNEPEGQAPLFFKGLEFSDYNLVLFLCLKV